MREIFTLQLQFFWDHQLQEIVFQWKMLQISQSRRLFPWWRADHMKRADTDQLQCQHMLVFILLTYISIEEKSMTGVLAVTLKLVHSVMDSASGFLQEIDLLLSTYLKVDITKCAIVRWALMLHFVMELINM